MKVLEGEASPMRCISDAMHLRCVASLMRSILMVFQKSFWTKWRISLNFLRFLVSLRI